MVVVSKKLDRPVFTTLLMAALPNELVFHESRLCFTYENPRIPPGSTLSVKLVDLDCYLTEYDKDDLVVKNKKTSIDKALVYVNSFLADTRE